MTSKETFKQIIENELNEESLSAIKEMCEKFGKDYDFPVSEIKIIRLPYPTFEDRDNIDWIDWDDVPFLRGETDNES